MVVRRVRLIIGGEIIEGAVTAVAGARAGGASVYQLTVVADDPTFGTVGVRAYREIDAGTRVRVRVHRSMASAACLAEWSHLGYELLIGSLFLIGGIGAAFAAAFL